MEDILPTPDDMIPAPANSPSASSELIPKGYGWGIVIAILLIVITIVATGTLGDKQAARVVANPGLDTGAKNRASTLAAKTGVSCAFGGKVTNTDFAVSSEAILLSEPKKAAAPVQLIVGNASVPAPLELSASVRELCRSGKWSEVYVTSNPFAKMQGWVLSSALKAVPVTETGRRIYQASDFAWPEDTGLAKGEVVQIANRIMDQRRECLALDTENLVLVGPGNRGTFSLPCFVPLDMKSFDFRAADAKNGRSFQ